MPYAGLHDDPLLKHVPRVDGYPVLPPCLIFGFIGRGGMGSVYLGRHLRLGVDVAVKCLSPDIADRSDTWVKRFQREAGLAARISHQNLVRAYDVLCRHDLNYLVMEVVHGENLRQRVERAGALSVDEAVAVIGQAAAGLGAAHAAGIVHRDVKPDNVLLSVDGEVKVADLGLAKALELMSGEVEATLHTTTMGTPQYMAPEQWEDTGSVGPPADVYALGATLWFLLAGRDARPKAKLRELRRRALDEAIEDIREVRDDVPDGLAALIRKATATDERERFVDAGAFLDALREVVGVGAMAGRPRLNVTSWTPPDARPTPDVLEAAKEAITDFESPGGHGGSEAGSGQPESVATGASSTHRARVLWVPVVLVALVAMVAAFMGDDEPAKPTRITMKFAEELSPRQLEMRRQLKETLVVAWDGLSIHEALADLTDRVDLPIRREFAEFDEWLADNAEQSPPVMFWGPATTETLLDVLCAAGSYYDLDWGMDDRSLVIGTGDVEQPIVGTVDISALSIPDAEEVLNIVRENVRPEDWDLSDAYNIDYVDADRLLLIHGYRAHMEAEDLLNRLLIHDEEREREIIDRPRRTRTTPVDPATLDRKLPADLLRELASQLGLAFEIQVEDARLSDLSQPVSLMRQDATVGDVLSAVEASCGWHTTIHQDRILLSDEPQGLGIVLVTYDISDHVNWRSRPVRRSRDFHLLPSGTDPDSFTDGVEIDEPLPLVSEDTLLSVIQHNIHPDGWTDDPDRSISQIPGLLIVRAPAEVHLTIRGLLDSLR